MLLPKSTSYTIGATKMVCFDNYQPAIIYSFKFPLAMIFSQYMSSGLDVGHTESLTAHYTKAAYEFKFNLYINSHLKH